MLAAQFDSIKPKQALIINPWNSSHILVGNISHVRKQVVERGVPI